MHEPTTHNSGTRVDAIDEPPEEAEAEEDEQEAEGVLPNNNNNNNNDDDDDEVLFSVGPYGVTEALPHCHQHHDGCNGALFRAIRTDLSSAAVDWQNKQMNPTAAAAGGGGGTYLLKVLWGSSATTNQPAMMRARMRHEFTVLKELEEQQVHGVVRAVELITTAERGLVLVLQDLLLLVHPHRQHHHQYQHGHTLRQLLLLAKKKNQDQEGRRRRRAIGLKEFFMIAIGVVEVLQRLHERGYVHKDIKPDCIEVLFVSSLNKEESKDEEGGGAGGEAEELKVQLLDFGICEKQQKQHQQQPSADTNNRLGLTGEEEEERESSSEEETKEKEKKTEGTWAYMSPEQTGRTKRLVDHRTDFYSLGMCNHLFSSSVFSSHLLLWQTICEVLIAYSPVKMANPWHSLPLSSRSILSGDPV